MPGRKKAPVERGKLLPVVRDIGFQFPIFLIYARQAAENLSRHMGF
jgi:hypothetical protein